MSAPVPSPTSRFSLANYAYAGLIATRTPFYLPDTVKPTGGAGNAANLTLNQSPFSNVAFLTGDNTRRILPLTFSGMYIASSEEAARLWGAALEESIPQWTGIQRSADVVRVLLPGGSVVWDNPEKDYIRPFTLTLYPAGPTWADSSGNSVPF